MQDRFSCAFNGTCEPDLTGSYASEAECQADCRSVEDKDINYLILQYAPLGLESVAPSDRAEVIRRITGATISRSYSLTISMLIEHQNWTSLSRFPQFRPWLSEMFHIPIPILHDVLQARQFNKWEDLISVPEAAPFVREAGYAPVFKIPIGAVSADMRIEWSVLTPEQLEDLARPYLDLKSLARGDVVHFEDVIGRDNTGRVIYDGKHLSPLDLSFDIGGSIPKTFLINDFPTTVYFKYALPASYWVYLDPTEFKVEDIKSIGVDLALLTLRSVDGGVLYIYSTAVEDQLGRWNAFRAPVLLQYDTGMMEPPDTDPTHTLYDMGDYSW
jgi:hypothetical protein